MPIIRSFHAQYVANHPAERKEAIDFVPKPKLAKPAKTTLGSKESVSNKEKNGYSFLFEHLAAKDENICPEQLKNHQDYIDALHRVASFTSSFGESDDMNGDGPVAPAFTYFGQFIDHDITAPLLASDDSNEQHGEVIQMFSHHHGLEELKDSGIPDNTQGVLAKVLNQHERPLFLDSLYAQPDFSGIEPEPEDNSLYEVRGGKRSPFFRTAPTTRSIEQDFVQIPDGQDFPRERKNGNPATKASTLVPVIADHRNDDNLILAQLHFLFMQFHNKAARELSDLHPEWNAQTLFEETRKLVTRHYHWMVVYDFLPQIADDKVLKALLHQIDSNISKTPDKGDSGLTVPLEFTTAAFRFGHSMIRPSYNYNANFGTGGRVSNRATITDLFAFTSAGGLSKDPASPDKLVDTESDRNNVNQLPNQWIADWARLFDKPNPEDNVVGSRKIDTHLTFQMNHLALFQHKLPEDFPSGHHSLALKVMIAYRNLMRGYYRRIPCGQILCSEIKKLVPEITELTQADLLNSLSVDFDKSFIKNNGLADKTPAWLYFLCEAKHCHDGNRLGPTASFIVVETILRLMANHRTIFARDNGKAWNPELSELKIHMDDGKKEAIAKLWDIVRYVKPPGTSLPS